MTNKAEWFCTNCRPQGKRHCPTCMLDKDCSQFNYYPAGQLHEKCKTCELTRTCANCGQEKTLDDYDTKLGKVCKNCKLKKTCTIESQERCRLCSGPNKYDPNRRFCYTCEFPKCAVCGVERSQTAGPRYKGKREVGISKGEPWYERRTHRPSLETQTETTNDRDHVKDCMAVFFVLLANSQ